MPTKKELLLSQARLKELLHYDQETGVFTSLVSRNGFSKGRSAGTVWFKKERSDLKYRYINVEFGRFQAHRLAWLYMTGEWPKDKVDHKDHDGLNNRWTNLRAATHEENMRNMRVRSDNTSGHKGVSWMPERQKWQVGIGYGGKRHALGRFDKKEDAIAAYESAAKRIFGEFAFLGTS